MANELTREMKWFLTTLQNEFGVTPLPKDVLLEAVELGINEVEDFYIPRELFKQLPTTFLYEIMMYSDKSGNEYVAGIAFYPKSPEWCLQVITKNNELMVRIPIALP